jgi:hypothetical protein
MEAKLLKDLIEAAGYEACPYSGRSMTGYRYVSLKCLDANIAIIDLFEACMSQEMEEDALADEHIKSVSQVMEEFGELCDVLRYSAQYTNDLEIILYFKSVEWQDDNN